MQLLDCNNSVCKKIFIESDTSGPTPNVRVEITIPTGLEISSTEVNYGTVVGNLWTIDTLPEGARGVMEVCFSPANCSVCPTGKNGTISISTSATESNLNNNVIDYVLEYITCCDINNCGGGGNDNPVTVAPNGGLAISGQQLSLRISGDANNAVEERANGLYVPVSQGGGATAGSFSVSFGTAVFEGEYVGNAPTISEGLSGNFTIVVPANSTITWFNFSGNSDDVDNADAGDLKIIVDNSANGVDRRFNMSVIPRVGGNANRAIDKIDAGFAEIQTLVGNVNTIRIPSLSGFGSTSPHTYTLTF